MRKQTAILFGILAAISAGYLVHDYVRPRTGTPHVVYIRACVCNLKMIASAKEEWAKSEHKTTNASPTDAELFGHDQYLRQKPECPLGGTYAIGTVGEPVKCSVEDHAY